VDGLDGCARKLEIAPVRLVAVSALVVGGTSGLAGSRRFLMQIGPYLFVV
jgi:hypothetical protein